MAILMAASLATFVLTFWIQGRDASAYFTKLGFEVPALHSRRAGDALSREAVLVMELDGPAYEATRQRAREIGARAAALAKGNPSSKALQQRANNAAAALKREENQNSRLFVVDAGRDAAALRAKYADSSRYLIVEGRIRPAMTGPSGKERRTGFIENVGASRINVPAAYRSRIESSSSAYVVDLATGKRLEPWVLGVSAP